MSKKDVILIIDRFEEDWAVLEYNDDTFDVPRELLPDEAKEGDVLKISFEIDKNKTLERQNKIKDLEDDLFI